MGECSTAGFVSLQSPYFPKKHLLSGIIWRRAGQAHGAIPIVIYNPKLGQAKTTYLFCIPTAAEELARDCRRNSSASRQNGVASVHIKPHLNGKCFSNESNNYSLINGTNGMFLGLLNRAVIWMISNIFECLSFASSFFSCRRERKAHK